ncbi:hypothetical protein BU26DRAFT_553602 [Trematosphaeria pertusa]|uniref:HNH nuclease domain-containing protein n=1 Tax=Trematosphaeria pertusa TaxID=390896 RepID=A0A6A6I3Y0_9PLEO|nr:uncharacterized protein BU26DRAFT_553602 [Trematosphaeria pertusa]KAF2245051.1 hypothetical protein BU26DRAFT_553602 [Trematosphaeria pertusa]
MATKRPFDIDGDNDAGSQTSRRSQGSWCARAPSQSARSFQSDVGDNLAAMYHGRVCWVCGLKIYVEKAHVFPKADPNLHRLRALGLLSLPSYRDTDNALHLCGGCHAAWDDEHRPGILIVPTYLDYFFAAEEKWQAACISTNKSRPAPTTAAYFQYCVSRDPRPDQIADSTRGGLYTCYLVEAFLPCSETRSHQELHWHGDPMAMMRRALVAATKIVWPPEYVPYELLGRLRELDMLYFKGNRLQRQILEQQPSMAPPPPPPPAPTRDPNERSGPDSRPAPNAHPEHDASAGAPPSSSAFPASSGTQQHGAELPTDGPERPPSPPLTMTPRRRKRRYDADTKDRPACKRIRGYAQEAELAIAEGAMRHNLDEPFGRAVDADLSGHYNFGHAAQEDVGKAPQSAEERYPDTLALSEQDLARSYGRDLQ